ncbi:MAG: hypothetical protein JKY65_06185 [Planctomycetes bacterium]|nr:hypothetical protein [Planctomycetota bacterium]
MTPKTLTPLLLLIGTLAHAQSALDRIAGNADRRPVEISTSWSREAATQQERDYVQGFATALGIRRFIPRVSSIEQTYPLATGNGQGQSRGVAFLIYGDDTLRRLRFRSVEAAQDYALRVANLGTREAARAIQVLGKQVLIVSGPSVRDPEWLGRVLRAGWSGLPHAPRSPDFTALFLGRNDSVAIVSHLKNPELDAALRAAAGRAREAGLSTSLTLGERESFLLTSSADADQVRLLRTLANQFRGASTANPASPAAETKPNPAQRPAKGILDALRGGLRDRGSTQPNR